MTQFSTNKLKPAIIGGGIGGLTLSVALQKHGIESNIYEAAPQLSEVGAGIMLASNAMQVFKKLGIYDKVAGVGNHIAEMQITRPDFVPLSSIKLEEFERRYGVHNVTIHRAALQKLLMEVVGDARMTLNSKLKEVSENKEGYNLRFDTRDVHANQIIGADGIHSKTRSYIDEHAEIRNAGQLCWRGVTEASLPEKYNHVAIEAWGCGKRFGMNRLNAHQVYWYALVNRSPRKEDEYDLPLIFSDFHPLVAELISATNTAEIIFNEIIDLKPINVWHKNNICLIGDAAHATTPNLGQGACQAIEDAWVLASCMSSNSTEEAYKIYQRRRFAVANTVVKRSWVTGKISQFENPLAIHLRNLAMRLTPDFLTTKQAGRLFELAHE